MKRTAVSVIAALIIIISMPYCKKSSGGNGGGGCNEGTIAVTTSPANGTVEPAAPGPDFTLTVNITNNLPAAGVKIEVKARPETSSTAFFTETKDVTTASTTFTITGTTAGVPCVVDVTVTSKSCNTNKVSSSYKFSRK